MMGGSDGTTEAAGIRHRKPDVGGAGDGGGGVRTVIDTAAPLQRLPPGIGHDGISIEERRNRALMARANEPQGARRFILHLAYASGQPIGDIERLRISEGLYFASLYRKR